MCKPCRFRKDRASLSSFFSQLICDVMILIQNKQPRRTVKMAERVSSTCPLCESPAEYIPTDFGRFREFICQNCNTFIAHEHDVEKIKALHKTIKEGLSDKAKKNPHGKILKIKFEGDQPSFVYLKCGQLG